MPVDSQVRDVVVVGGQVGVPGPTTRVAVTADMRREYVAAGGYDSYDLYSRVLGFTIDDVTAAFGDDLYDRMLLNDHVAGVFNGFRSAVLEDGMQLRPAIE